MEDGWIKLYWKVKDSMAWGCGSSAALWVHILLSATKKKQVLPDGRVLKPGQCLLSQATISRWLGVNRKTVAKYIAAFESDGMIQVASADKKGTILTVCNFKSYQKSGTRARTSSGQHRSRKSAASEQHRDSKSAHTESPESRVQKRESSAPRQLARPAGGLEEAKAYWQHKRLRGSATDFYNYNQARGWKGVEDWTAAAELWSSREQTYAGKEMAGRRDVDLTMPQGDGGQR